MRALFALLAILLPVMAAGQDAPPGALSCAGCHDPALATELSLDGMTAEDIVSAVADIRNGGRDATLMNRIAAGFTDAEIEAIALWLVPEE